MACDILHHYLSINLLFSVCLSLSTSIFFFSLSFFQSLSPCQSVCLTVYLPASLLSFVFHSFSIYLSLRLSLCLSLSLPSSFPISVSLSHTFFCLLFFLSFFFLPFFLPSFIFCLSFIFSLLLVFLSSIRPSFLSFLILFLSTFFPLFFLSPFCFLLNFISAFNPGPEALSSARDKLKAYRIDSNRLTLLRDALKCYEGTQSYHNFTTGKHPSDANAKRYIISFTCGEPFVDVGSDSEWVLLSVVGQSFLLNQIRKMVGLASEVTNGQVSISMMKDALSKQKVFILHTL